MLKDITSSIVPCPSGAATVLEIPQCRKGVLWRLAVTQRDGDLEGYTVDVFERASAADGTLTEKDLYRVVPRQTVAALSASLLLVGEYPYVLPDAPAASGKIGDQYLRVVITPAGAGSKNFQVRLVVENDPSLL